MNSVRPLHRILFYLVAGFSLCAPQHIHAQAVVINDCQGFTRAVRQAEPGEPTNVEVQVSTAANEPAQNSIVRLTNVITGEVREVQAAQGLAKFPGLPPGVYSISAADQGLQLGTIWMGASGASAALATGVGAGTVILGGGAAIEAGVQLNELTNGNSANPTPTPTPQATPTPVSTARPNPTPTPCPVCNPDAEPTPVDDFFKSEQEQQVEAQRKILSPYK